MAFQRVHDAVFGDAVVSVGQVSTEAEGCGIPLLLVLTLVCLLKPYY